MAEGQVVHVSVLGAQGLRDTEWFTKQDPYVVLEYGHQRFRSATDIDGHTDPALNLHVSLRVFPSMHEFTLVIWNENNLRDDNVIGSTRIDMRSVLASGFDDSSWAVFNAQQVHRGSVRIVMRTVGTHAVPPPPFKPHSSAPYDQHHSSPYRPHLSVPCEPHHPTPYEPHPSAPNEPHHCSPYEPHSSVAYEPHHFSAFEPQPAAPYVPQPSAPYEPQPSAPYEPPPSAPYEPHRSSSMPHHHHRAAHPFPSPFYQQPHHSMPRQFQHKAPDPPPSPHQQPHYSSPHHCHQPAADSASPPCQPQHYSSQQHQTAAHPAPACGPPPTSAPPASPHGSTGGVPGGGRNSENRDRIWNKVGIVADVLGTAVGIASLVLGN